MLNPSGRTGPRAQAWEEIKRAGAQATFPEVQRYRGSSLVCMYAYTQALGAGERLARGVFPPEALVIPIFLVFWFSSCRSESNFSSQCKPPRFQCPTFFAWRTFDPSALFHEFVFAHVCHSPLRGIGCWRRYGENTKGKQAGRQAHCGRHHWGSR